MCECMQVYMYMYMFVCNFWDMSSLVETYLLSGNCGWFSLLSWILDTVLYATAVVNYIYLGVVVGSALIFIVILAICYDDCYCCCCCCYCHSVTARITLALIHSVFVVFCDCCAAACGSLMELRLTTCSSLL